MWQKFQNVMCDSQSHNSDIHIPYYDYWTELVPCSIFYTIGWIKFVRPSITIFNILFYSFSHAFHIIPLWYIPHWDKKVLYHNHLSYPNVQSLIFHDSPLRMAGLRFLKWQITFHPFKWWLQYLWFHLSNLKANKYIQLHWLTLTATYSWKQ